MRKWIPYILSGLFLFICLCVTNLSTVSIQTKVDEQESTIASLQNEITLNKADQEQKRTIIVGESTGLDTNRVARDDSIAITFLKKCLTWSSYEEYTNVRNDLMHDYNLKDDSNFLSVFMPEVVNSTTPDGTNYNRIDVFGYNLSYDKMSSYVTNISDDDVYSYFAFVTVSGHTDDGYEGSTTAAFIYTIDADGNMINIDANAIS